MNENEFEHKGVVYVTEPMSEKTCIDCRFYVIEEACVKSRCLASQRNDRTQVIYKEKQ